jgi:diguanylate cyclase (GGDEF)-like protein
LLKHAAIKEMVEIEVARSRRKFTPVTVGMLDIDHFKAVNDNYGHAVGDLVISSVAMLLRQRLRHSDIVGRYGGEEFAVILPECSAEDAVRLLDDVRQRFSEVQFNHQGKIFTCTLSAGLASSRQLPDFDGTELLVAADEALYVAKRSGRNQIQSAPGAYHRATEGEGL